MKIAILGAQGMLGSMVTKVLSSDPDIEVSAFGRKELDAFHPEKIGEIIGNVDWVINCIGIIKPLIQESALEATVVNSVFPYALSLLEANIIQIATDCVFSGNIPIYDSYTEESPHDAHDIYGKTKSLGEVFRSNFYNIRCSIIGPQKDNTSLLQWFLDLPPDSNIKGFHGHQWNGITTLAFAEVCRGIIKGDKPVVNNFNLVPANSFTKYQLLHVFAETFNRPDIKIEIEDKNKCNRRLDTIYPENNEKMWRQAGYSGVPSIQELLTLLRETL